MTASAKARPINRLAVSDDGVGGGMREGVEGATKAATTGRAAAAQPGQVIGASGTERTEDAQASGHSSRSRA
jgi:hypothetical protein